MKVVKICKITISLLFLKDCHTLKKIFQKVDGVPVKVILYNCPVRKQAYHPGEIFHEHNHDLISLMAFAFYRAYYVDLRYPLNSQICQVSSSKGFSAILKRPEGRVKLTSPPLRSNRVKNTIL